ncbi:MAG: TerB family tellurite resistance protein, partial [Gemmatimonadaceae bacterium]
SESTAAWETALKAYRQKSVKECVIAATNAMAAKQRLAAMANLVDIAMADGELAGAEKSLLEAYVTAFGIREDEVARIVDVISIKNNKALFA